MRGVFFQAPLLLTLTCHFFGGKGFGVFSPAPTPFKRQNVAPVHLNSLGLFQKVKAYLGLFITIAGLTRSSTLSLSMRTEGSLRKYLITTPLGTLPTTCFFKARGSLLAHSKSGITPLSAALALLDLSLANLFNLPLYHGVW
jgi:hypothetical protein